MTTEQVTAINRYKAKITADTTPEPQIARVDGREYVLKPLAPCLRFFVRYFDNGRIAIGTGFETSLGDAPGIQICDWAIIDQHGRSLDREHLTPEELQFSRTNVTYGPYTKEIGHGILPLQSTVAGL